MKALFLALMLVSAPAFADGPAPVTTAPAVAVAQPAAPPEWAQSLMVRVEALPVVGPVVTKAIMYLTIGVSLLTSFIAAILGFLNAASGVLNLAGIAGLATKLQDFKEGKIMYWLKYLSMFNAKKPEPKKSIAA